MAIYLITGEHFISLRIKYQTSTEIYFSLYIGQDIILKLFGLILKYILLITSNPKTSKFGLASDWIVKIQGLITSRNLGK